MSKEAMKLAIRSLKELVPDDSDHAPAIQGQRKRQENAIKALQEALAKPDFWEGYVPEPVKPAQQALDEMAWNAKELGLDYEPVWGGGPSNKDYEDAMRQRRLHQLTSPPAQRTLQGLTDEERKLVRNSVGYNQFVTAGEYAEHVQKATEAKLKEKNK